MSPDEPVDPLVELIDSADSTASEATLAVATSTAPMVLFRSATRWYAVRAEQVREVVPAERVSRVPALPSHILGVALIHSRLVPVVDLTALMGGRAPAGLEKCRLVVLGSAAAEVSIVAQEARGVFEVPLPSGGLTDPTIPNFVDGEVNWQDRLVCILDGYALVDVATQDATW